MVGTEQEVEEEGYQSPCQSSLSLSEVSVDVVPTFNLSLTQSLGHHNFTGFLPEVVTVPFLPMDEVQIVIASDGLFDIIKDDDSSDLLLLATASATEIAEFAEKRWKQEWKYIPDIANPEEFSYTHFPGFDDVSVGVWKYTPNSKKE